jgi:6-phosphogluconolactonase (cycloisomerase 2 family)
MSKATNLLQRRPCGSAWASREQQEIGGKAMCKRMKWNQANHLVRAVLLILLPLGFALTTHAQSFAYVANQADGTVSAYKIDSTTGVLSQLSNSPFAARSFPKSVTVDPSGKFAYVVNEGGNVSAYTIDSASGALSQLGNSPFLAGSRPFSVAVDPSGKFAYVANSNSNNVSAYTIDSTTGALSQLSSSPFPAGTSPFSVAVDPSGKFAYVANGDSNNVSAYTIDSASGALSQLSNSPFATGRFPVSVAIAVVNSTEPFATFNPQAVIDMDENAFVTFGSFTLGTGSGSDGIAPATEPVQLKVGTFSITIPAGSFRKNRAGGRESESRRPRHSF